MAVDAARVAQQRGVNVGSVFLFTNKSDQFGRQFVRRHAFGVTAGVTFIVFVIAFAITMSVQTQRIAAERDTLPESWLILEAKVPVAK